MLLANSIQAFVHLHNKIITRRFNKVGFATIDETVVENEESIIILTDKAKSHLLSLKKNDGESLVIRMGVKSGGCSGMSYVMDLIKPDEVTEEDHIEVYDDVKCVVDPKSLLYIYGLKLDYSDELIGGGFKFSNPNAETSCGCGKSFGV